MIILGLQFGHDAGIALLRDGRVVRSLIRERHNRVKHSLSIDTAHIDLVLEEAGLSVDGIDMIALTSGPRGNVTNWSATTRKPCPSSPSRTRIAGRRPPCKRFSSKREPAWRTG